MIKTIPGVPVAVPGCSTGSLSAPNNASYSGNTEGSASARLTSLNLGIVPSYIYSMSSLRGLNLEVSTRIIVSLSYFPRALIVD